MMHAFSLARLVLVWMSTLVAPDSVPWGETYPETAEAIATACEEYPTAGSPERCAAVLTALGYEESRFRPDAVGDHGQSVGPYQLSRVWGVTAHSSPEEHARTAAALVRHSLAMCRSRPMDERLGWFAAGGAGCGRPASSRLRMRLAASLLH